jgi:hypothetical protein
LRSRLFCAGLLLVSLLWTGRARAQSQVAADGDPLPQAAGTEPDFPIAPLIHPAKPPASVFNNERIMGVIPEYQTVDDSTRAVPPLTARQKWDLALKETIDPFNLVGAGFGAGFSQAANQTPKYGVGAPALGERFGAAIADMSTQNFFSAGLLAVLLHQDPRYFRLGPQASIRKRVWYSITQLVICRQDSGKRAFNASNVVGMMMGIAASNLYYPPASVRWSVMAGRLDTSMFGGLTGNLMSEFWPDIHDKFFHHKHN